jgi:hypothetical protein
MLCMYVGSQYLERNTSSLFDTTVREVSVVSDTSPMCANILVLARVHKFVLVA